MKQVKFFYPYLAALISLLFIQVCSARPVFIPDEIRGRVIQQLAFAYGNQWDAQNKCMRFSDNNAMYCIRVIDLQKKTNINGQQYFLTIAGDAYDEHGNLQNAGHAQAGLMGLFLFEKLTRGWTVVGARPSIMSGQWGLSQAENYQIKQIGPNHYAWIGEESASGAGGESMTSYNIYALVTGKLSHIADIEVAHHYIGSYSRDKKVKLRMLQQGDLNGFFPISAQFEQIVAPVSDEGEIIEQKQKIKTKQKIIYFNHIKGAYFDPFRD